MSEEMNARVVSPAKVACSLKGCPKTVQMGEVRQRMLCYETKVI